MSRQERKIRLIRAADDALVEIYEKALAQVKERAEEREAWPRPSDMTKGDWDVACAVRLMREHGMAWWELAYRLGLPGSAASVRDGKAGAGQARKLYRAAFGDTPKGVRASSARAAKAERHEATGPVFDGTRTLEEICTIVAGKKLVFLVRAGSGDTLVVGQDEAIVSPKGADIYSDEAICFHTVEYGEPEKGKGKGWFRGPERIVRVANIISVGDGIPPGMAVA